MMRRNSGSCLPLHLADTTGNGASAETAAGHRAAMIVSPSSPPAACLQHVYTRSDGIRIRPAGVHDPGTGHLATSSKRSMLPAHEQDLPGEVGVVGARLRTRLHQRQPVFPMGPDRRDQGLGRLGHRLQRRRIGGVGGDQRPVDAQFVADGLEFGQGAPGQQ